MNFFKKRRDKIKCRIIIYRYLFNSIKGKLRLFFGMTANILYILWNTLLAFLYHDPLLFAISVYYTLLALMRYALLKKDNSDAFEERQTVFTVGLLLIPTVLSMAGVMISTLLRGIKKNYSPLTVIPQSLFVLFCLVGAVIRISMHKKHLGANALCIDVISLSAAFFSIFNLVNYLSRIGIPHFDGRLTLAVGLTAVITVFAFALILIGQRKKDGR